MPNSPAPVLSAPVTRRLFLGSVVAVGGIVLVGCTTEDAALTSVAPSPTDSLRPFLTVSERDTVEALASRIIPGSPADPGAIEAGVVDYIDRKLAQHAAFAQPTFLASPYVEVIDAGASAPAGAVLAVPSDQLYRYGYQSGLLPHTVYRRGIPALDRLCVAQFGAPFAQLPESTQDEVLDLLDRMRQNADDGSELVDQGGSDNQSDSSSAPSAQSEQIREIFSDSDPAEFFSTVLTDCKEGMFADPSYGGNQGLVGWRLVGYPGYQRAYSPAEMLRPLRREPQPLADLPSMNPDRHDEHALPALEQSLRGVRDG